MTTPRAPSRTPGRKTIRRWSLAGSVGAAALAAFSAAGGNGVSPAAAAATAPSAPSARAPAARAAPPNIIVILADDLGYGDTSVYGSPVIRTPNIDRLAAEGTRFTDAYVTHPVCSPSRAGLLTGRYQERFGYEFNPVGRDNKGGVSLREIMIGQIMKTARYATGMVGKWHLGTPAGYSPADRGFDEFFGMTAGASTYIIDPKPDDHFFNVPGAEAAERATAEPDPRLAALPFDQQLKFFRSKAPIYRGHTIVEERSYLTDAFTREGVSFIERHKKQPFFLYLAYNAPHVPLQAPDKYYARFPEIQDPAKRTYAAMVSALDDGVGAIMQKLKDSGLDRNTLVIFLSDNGCAGYLKGACSNAPLSGFKGTHLEGGIRVPFIMRWPGRIPAGRVDDRQISSLDIVPTAAALGGAKLPRDRVYDGVDLMPFITGKNPGVPNPVLFWRAGVNFAVRNGPWKMMVANKAPASVSVDLSVPPIMPEGVQARIGPEGQHVMLYSLPTDIAEKRNLATANPRVVAKLKGELAKWNKTLVLPQWTSRRWAYIRWDDENLQLFN
ncbi:MAG: sulfatase-like hydrolase/transferase [Proteobacteria bacterium]|nr:sulfatase-like hydrolase/transferase [Pseudomonadota bacterium]